VKPPTEAQEARAFMQWCKLHSYMFTHVKNETGRSTAGRRVRNYRAMWNYMDGVRAGFPDFVIIAAGHVIFIELKRTKGGTVSPAQKEWVAELKGAGANVEVCRGAEEAINYVKMVTAR
jgi:hypothetical protein